MESIGEKIAILRQKKGITQVDLAKVLHVSPSTMCRWEKNERTPSKEDITRMADFFDVSADYFNDNAEGFLKKHIKLAVSVAIFCVCTTVTVISVLLAQSDSYFDRVFVNDKKEDAIYQEYYVSKKNWDPEKALDFSEKRRNYLIEHSSYNDADLIEFYFYESKDDYLENNCIMLKGYYIEKSD